MTKARDLSKLANGVPNSLINLDSAEIPNLDASKITTGELANARVADLPASKITSGTFADARISQSSVSQHAQSFDDSKLQQDIMVLALQQATDANRSAYNLSNSFVEQFEDSTGIHVQTNTSRDIVGEYVSSIAVINSKIITKWNYHIDASAYATWNIQGSNNGSTWTTLYSGLSSSGGGLKSTGTFVNTTSYRYYRSYKTDGATGGNYHRELYVYDENNNLINLTAGMITFSNLQSMNIAGLIDNNTSTAGFHTDSAGVGAFLQIDFANYSTTASATGNFTSVSQTAPATVSKMGIVVLYKNNAGTATLNTDLVAQVSANNGTNYTTVTLTPRGTFSTGINIAVANNVTVTSGTSVKYKISFANQSVNTKDTQVHGVGLIY